MHPYTADHTHRSAHSLAVRNDKRMFVRSAR